MKHVRSRAFRAFALPTVVLLGAANIGCPSNVSSSQSTTGTSNNGGGGAGGDAGGGGNTGTAGSGGVTCAAETEICDGADNDCNGQVDDVAGLPQGCTCNDGQSQACYSGPAGTQGVGACVGGNQLCANGTWGECTGQVVPGTESCNLADDDCNGTVDDMGTASCGVGACAASIDKCIDGQAQTCMPGQPSVEVCDGMDNNCNQLTDESDPMLDANCDTASPGVCALGKIKCVNRALVCAANIMPSEEMCDALDNDCDGTVDNNIVGTGGTCGTGALGVCSAGTIACKVIGGVGTIDCFGNVESSPETCDGLDNDCNGAVDQGNPEGGGACNTGLLGTCQAGTLNCVNGGVTCTQNVQAGAETCNGQDDNCDGQNDEGNPGGGQMCGCAGQGVTVCQNGAVSCNGGPISYFFEDFKDNSKGWTLGTTWQIGPAVSGCSGFTPDPGQDHTPTADNGLAGVVIGGCAPTALHDFYWLESPTFNTANAVGTVYLQFWRHLNSDYISYMQNKVQVYNGSAWVDLPYGTTGSSPGVQDTTWQNHGVGAGSPLQPTNSAQYPTQFDVTQYKNANMRVRFGYNIASGGVYTIGSWSVDDVLVASAICP